jgi:hypothetical protein
MTSIGYKLGCKPKVAIVQLDAHGNLLAYVFKPYSDNIYFLPHTYSLVFSRMYACSILQAQHDQRYGSSQFHTYSSKTFVRSSRPTFNMGLYFHQEVMMYSILHVTFI